MPGSGLLAATVPGAFGGWLLLLREYGTLRLRDVLGYAIGYAQSGYPLVPAISWSIASVADLFREHWHSSAEVYLPGGGVPAPGTRFANRALAATYQRVLAEAEAASDDRDAQLEAARRAWYDGFVAEEIGKFAATAVMDVTGERHRGPAHRPRPGHLARPPGSPGQLRLSRADRLQDRPLGPGPGLPAAARPAQRLSTWRPWNPAAPSSSTSVTEAGKLAFADREAWYGDPDFTDVPLDDLLSDDYNDERRKLIGETASMELRPGRPGGTGTGAAGLRHAPVRDARTLIRRATPAGERRPGDRPRHRRAPGPAPPHAQARRGDTCHLDVADRWGNVVTATPSGGWLQSSPVIPSLGFCLGTRAQMFTLTPGLPATIAPGKRPRTTLTPTLALRDGEPYLAFGTPGGDQQDQWTLGVLPEPRALRDEPAAGDRLPGVPLRRTCRPRSTRARPTLAGSTWSPGSATTWSDELRRRGHDVHVQPPWSLGRISAVARRGGLLYAAANARGMQGYAVGR